MKITKEVIGNLLMLQEFCEEKDYEMYLRPCNFGEVHIETVFVKRNVGKIRDRYVRIDEKQLEEIPYNYLTIYIEECLKG